MSFPPRTPRSDMKATEVSKALARANKGEAFMVACVDTGTLTYVALSGEPSRELLTELQAQLMLDKILLSEMPSKNALEKQKSAAKKVGDNDAFQAAAKTQRHQASLKRNAPKLSSAYVVVTDACSLSSRMMDPDKREVIQRASAYQDVRNMGLEPNVNPLEFGASRNCAEPKVLEAVGLARLKPAGMTTVWYGTGPNPYPDPRVLPHASPALPCAFCRANARRIMLHAFR